MALPPVSLSSISRVVGYAVNKANFGKKLPYLPQRIALVAELNTLNQGASTAAVEITSAQQVGALAGYGSPAHQAARMLFPANTGSAVPGIPVWFYPILEAAGATANVQTITVTGTVTANVTHTLYVTGRNGLEGGSYNFTVAVGDTVTAIAVKIKNAINSVLGCPVTAANTAGVVTTTTKWKGLTAQETNFHVETNGNAAGISYAVAETTAGSGTASLSGLNLGSAWTTMVINGLGFVSSGVIDALTTINGNPNTRTGNYTPNVFRPFMAFTGSVLDTTTATADAVITEAQLAECTITGSPAPMSLGYSIEVATADCIAAANIANNTPNIDSQDIPLTDVPAPLPTSIPAEQSWTVREAVVQKGMSTALIVDGSYRVQDPVTTYHPVGEYPPSFRYRSDLIKDWNIKFQFLLMLNDSVVNKQIANDDDIVDVDCIKPKDIKGKIYSLAKLWVLEGLISDAGFTKDSIVVEINGTNQNRFDISFNYKRSGIVRQVSVNAFAGFNN